MRISSGRGLRGHLASTLVDMNDIHPEKLAAVVRDTGPDPARCVIWLHGLGADGHDFEPIVPQLKAAAGHSIRFVFPHAPVRPVTINGGMAMRAWYDILGMSIDRDQDAEGIAASVAAVDRLIDEQLESGYSPRDIVLAGFSQGGAVALRCGLARHRPLAGIVALSCYLLDQARLEQWMAPANRDLAIFMGHGSQDPMVPVALGQAAARRLEKAGCQVEFRTWPIGHGVCPEELEAIDGWLDRRLG